MGSIKPLFLPQIHPESPGNGVSDIPDLKRFPGEHAPAPPSLLHLWRSQFWSPSSQNPGSTPACLFGLPNPGDLWHNGFEFCVGWGRIQWSTVCLHQTSRRVVWRASCAVWQVLIVWRSQHYWSQHIEPQQGPLLICFADKVCSLRLLYSRIAYYVSAFQSIFTAEGVFHREAATVSWLTFSLQGGSISISSAASPVILHHTVWKLIIQYNQFSLPQGGGGENYDYFIGCTTLQGGATDTIEILEQKSYALLFHHQIKTQLNDLMDGLVNEMSTGMLTTKRPYPTSRWGNMTMQEVLNNEIIKTVCCWFSSAFRLCGGLI